MEKLINHMPICSLLYTGNTTGARLSFEESFDTLKAETNSLPQCRLFVQSLNFCIYNYILMKENISLHQCCITNHEQVLCALDLNTLKVTGLNIINQYAECQDYLFEKFSHPEIKKAVQHMHQHMDEPLTLENLCEAVNMNKCYFCTLFKHDTGYTFTQYLNHIRIHTAKRLIEESSLPLHEISLRCGFNSYSYFCTTFKKITSMSPTEYSHTQKIG